MLESFKSVEHRNTDSWLLNVLTENGGQIPYKIIYIEMDASLII